jgi:hypothetical protein
MNAGDKLLVSGLVTILLSVTQGQVQFSGASTYSAGTGPHAVAIGDFKGDGKQDLAVVNNSPSLI